MNFLKNYKHPKNIRFESFKLALTEAYKRNHKILVETGVSRGRKKFWFFKSFNKYFSDASPEVKTFSKNFFRPIFFKKFTTT